MTDFYGHNPPQLDTHCYADPKMEYFENKDVMAILESAEFQNVYAMSLFVNCVGLDGAKLRQLAMHQTIMKYFPRIDRKCRSKIDIEKLIKTALKISYKSRFSSIFILNNVIVGFVSENYTLKEKVYSDDFKRVNGENLPKFIYGGTIKILSKMITEFDYKIKTDRNFGLCKIMTKSKSYKKMILENVLPEYLGDRLFFDRNPFIFRDDLFKRLNDRRPHA